MDQPRKAQTLIARLAGVSKHVAHPLGWIELSHHRPGPDQDLAQIVHSFKVLLTSEEARQLSRELRLLAEEMDAMGRPAH
jgi:hypothetical protein